MQKCAKITDPVEKKKCRDSYVKKIKTKEKPVVKKDAEFERLMKKSQSLDKRSAYLDKRASELPDTLFKFLKKNKTCKQLFEENAITDIKSFVLWSRINNNANSAEFMKIKQCVDEYFALKNKPKQKRKRKASTPFQISTTEDVWMSKLPDRPKKQKGPSRKAPRRPEIFDPTLRGEVVKPTVATIQDMPRKKRTTKMDLPVNKSEIRKLCKQLKDEKKNKTQKSGTKKTNPWFDHIKQVRSDNPGLSYKDAMQKAKTSYKK
jgi:hypothetical protein